MAGNGEQPNVLVNSESNTDSIEVTLTAKGNYTYCAKVYYGTTDDELNRAFARLEQIDTRFRARYNT